MKRFICLLLLTTPVWGQTTFDITATPNTAVIVVDHDIKGVGHVTLEVTPGAHLVRVSDGEAWQPWIQTVTATAGQSTPLQVKLQPGSQLLIRRAREKMAQGHLNQAMADLLRATQIPRQVAPWWWMGVLQWKSGNPNDAVAALREYAQFINDWPDLYLFLGLCHQQAGRLPEAFTAYKKALTLSPSLANVLNGLPQPSSEAIAAFKRPSQPDQQLRLAQLLMLKGSMPEAVNWARAAADQIYPGWSSRDWTQVEPKLPAPPPDPTLQPTGDH